MVVSRPEVDLDLRLHVRRIDPPPHQRLTADAKVDAGLLQRTDERDVRIVPPFVPRLERVVVHHDVGAAPMQHDGNLPVLRRHAVLRQRVDVTRHGLQHRIDPARLGRFLRHRERHLVDRRRIWQLLRLRHVPRHGYPGINTSGSDCAEAGVLLPRTTASNAVATTLIVFICPSISVWSGTPEYSSGQEALPLLGIRQRIEWCEPQAHDSRSLH